MAFVGFNGEPDTDPLFARLAVEGKRLLLPRVEPSGIVAADGNSPLVASKFGVHEPTGPAVDLGEIDLVIVPGLAFTPAGRSPRVRPGLLRPVSSNRSGPVGRSVLRGPTGRRDAVDRTRCARRYGRVRHDVEPVHDRRVRRGVGGRQSAHGADPAIRLAVARSQRSAPRCGSSTRTARRPARSRCAAGWCTWIAWFASGRTCAAWSAPLAAITGRASPSPAEPPVWP